MPRTKAVPNAWAKPPSEPTSKAIFSPVPISTTSRSGCWLNTGATMIALTSQDARRLGLRPTKSDFTIPVNTANGRTYFAKAKLRSVRIGNTEERNIKATIAPKGVLDITLLGMSYLKQLKRFEISNGKLVLEN